MTKIKNANLFTETGFVKGDLTFHGNLITAIERTTEAQKLEEKDLHVIDAQGGYLVPGFIDIHIHGAAGKDFCDGSKEDFAVIAKYLASVGVTSFLGTSMSYDIDTLTGIFKEADDFMTNQNNSYAKMQGINMEGPFFSVEKKGAQASKYIIDPDMEFFQKLNDASGNRIKLLDIAPELDGAMDFIKEVSKLCTVSLGHTGADYDTASHALQNGASHVTHLYNAMPPFNHRAPGVIGAAADFAETVEIICDGVHLHPSTIRTTFRMFGRERICLISDAMRACGLPDGEYELGGQPVFVTGNTAALKNGTIAGACTPLPICVKNVIDFGVPAEDAIYCATVVPAKRAGIFDRVGSIDLGKTADLLILNQDYSVRQVIVNGNMQQISI